MRKQPRTKETTHAAGKRLLAAGSKINGTWNVVTFLRPASGTVSQPFWESTRQAAARSR